MFGRLSRAPLGDSSEGQMERLSWKDVHPGGANGWGKRRDGGHGERLTDRVLREGVGEVAAEGQEGNFQNLRPVSRGEA